MLALFVDAYDVCYEAPHKFKDDVLKRYDTPMDKNADLRSAIIDVKAKKDVRLREEDRKRKGLLRSAERQHMAHKMHPKDGYRNAGVERVTAKNRQEPKWDDVGDLRSRELTEGKVKAVMSRLEEFLLRDSRGRHGKNVNVATHLVARMK